VVHSAAKSVDQYLAELEPERRENVEFLRGLCLKHLPGGLEESMNWGMISYQVPFETVSKTYNGQPLLFAAIASQKHYISLYLMSIYAFEEERDRFESEWKATGKRFDAGKACIRLRNTEQIPVDVLIRALKSVSVDGFVRQYAKQRSEARKV
jgi:hypothetical protein